MLIRGISSQQLQFLMPLVYELFRGLLELESRMIAQNAYGEIVKHNSLLKIIGLVTGL